MKETKVNTIVEYHADIKFLLYKMEKLLVNEEYERMVVLKRWVIELIDYHHGKNSKK